MHVNRVSCSSDSYPCFCPVHTQNLVFVSSQVIQRSFATGKTQVFTVTHLKLHEQLQKTKLVPGRNTITMLSNRSHLAVINTSREYHRLSTISDIFSAFSTADYISFNVSYIPKEKSSKNFHLLANYPETEI